MAQRKWETIIAPKHTKDAASAIRRIRVPGGFLYQVEHHVEVSDGAITWIEWSTPVFVPFHGDGE